MMGRRSLLVGLGMLGAAHASGQELPRLLEPPAGHSRYSAVGLASWYGGELHGRRTADGERFDMNSLTAAHRSLPLPCYARVTNLRNGRSIVVRVNDRGPFVGSRIIDVSARVAGLLDFSHVGVAKVRLDYVGKAAPAGTDGPALLASLQNHGAPIVSVAPAVVARPAPDEGVTVAARFVEPAHAVEPRSPYGDLITYPFLVQAAER